MSLNLDTDWLRSFLTLIYKDHPILVMIITCFIIIIFLVFAIIRFIRQIKKQWNIAKIEEHTKYISNYFKSKDKKNKYEDENK